MTAWEITLLYMGVGVVNVVTASLRGRLMFAEFVFYLLFWPIQAVFLTLVGIHAGLDWILEKMFA